MKNRVLLFDKSSQGVDLKKVKELAIKILKEADLTRVELSLVMLGEDEARQLNMDYRKMEYIPEVLAFPLTKEEVDEDGWTRLGDIVLCVDEWKREMKSRGGEKWKIVEEWLRHALKNLLK
ncbi:hypothetical protein DRH14_01085 [Candidatus Shapirobacteria bacterium]|nr:MAG: hypothetical protein DRH14_01085 [Candidatus Shapirobacteria bacterium]